jgi:nicotinate-nucleotide adenylyltransferase
VASEALGHDEGTGPARPRVAFFGGSFDPPHVGHVLAAAYVLSTQDIDRVLVAPVFQHPFAKSLTSFADRMAMCRLAFGWLPGVEVSDVEARLGGESLTLRTLEHLAAERPGDAFRLVIGSDVVADLPKWHRFDRIAELAPPLILPRALARTSASRAGDDGASASAPQVLPAVSSSEIREAIAAAGEHVPDLVRALVSRRVVEHIVARRLYRA